MPRKKKDEETLAESTEAVETEGPEVEAADAAEPSPAKRSRKAAETGATDEPAVEEEPSIVETVLDAAADAMVTVAETIGKGAADVVSAIAGTGQPVKARQHKRAEKIGIVSSDKMMKTVTVRVDRLVKHPVYRKYVKKRKKFMAHDETGAKIGDKVRIVETRPLSARKRWRVVEIIQKAEL